MFRHRTSLLLLQVALGLSILIRCVMQCARPRLGESDESDPRESGVKVAPLKSHEKTRFKRHFHRQSTRTMRLKTNTIVFFPYLSSMISIRLFPGETHDAAARTVGLFWILLFHYYPVHVEPQVRMHGGCILKQGFRIPGALYFRTLGVRLNRIFHLDGIGIFL